MFKVLQTADQCSNRSVVRRQEMMQKHLEKCEEIMAAKSEAKDALAKEVHVYHAYLVYIMTYHTSLA